MSISPYNAQSMQFLDSTSNKGQNKQVHVVDSSAASW
jgi:hypothetical protein